MSLSPSTSEEVLSSPSRLYTHSNDSAGEVFSPALLEEVVDEEKVAHSDFWRLVDTPEFVPGKPYTGPSTHDSGFASLISPKEGEENPGRCI